MNDFVGLLFGFTDASNGNRFFCGISDDMRGPDAVTFFSGSHSDCADGVACEPYRRIVSMRHNDDDENSNNKLFTQSEGIVIRDDERRLIRKIKFENYNKLKI